MAQRLLEGELMEGADTGELVRLRELNRNLSRELSDALHENEEMRARLATANAPVARLREKLSPFYKLLQAIFGDIDELAPEGAAPSSGPAPSKSSAVWDSWKSRLPGAPAKIIEAMQLHKDVTVEQLVVLTQISRKQTIYDAISRMNKAGIINKNGGRFSLKQL